MLVVLALGGNALIGRGERPDVALQRRNLAVAVDSIASLVDRGHQLVLTHGNGPQVGLLALQAAACREVDPYPLDVLDAESEGMVGYLLEQSLRNRLPKARIATLLTQVLVSADDPAFGRPTKPLGPVYPPAVGLQRAAELGWTMVPDGDGVRRAVPSPVPVRIIELDVIRLLVDAGVILICAGGGGIPVIQRPDGSIDGVEAVIDKDRASAHLAEAIGADALLLLTDVDAVYELWGTRAARAIRRADVETLRSRQFAGGSMGPKVASALEFVERTGGTAGIGHLADAAAILDGTKGTLVKRSFRLHSRAS